MKLFNCTFSAIVKLISFMILLIMFCSSIRSVKMKSSDKPMLLNVTYETPMRDLDEERKYTMEHLNYMKKVKRLEQKFSEDIELLKMIMNIQNSQIERLNEIVMVNNEIANEINKAKN